MADVFISYSSKDSFVANTLVTELEGKGITCWIAPRNIIPGSDWADSISNAIVHSKVMIVICSCNSNSSKQVSREINNADNKGKVIIPYKIDNTTLSGSFDYFFTSSHWVEASPNANDYKIDELYSVISSVLQANMQTVTNITINQAYHVDSASSNMASNKCPNCGAELHNNVCDYCGSKILPRETTTNITNNYYNTNYTQNNTGSSKKTWLWVLGWICIFPVPLTILMLRKKDMNPTAKYGIIAAAWVLYLIIGLFGDNEDKTATNEITSYAENVQTEQAAITTTENIQTTIETMLSNETLPSVTEKTDTQTSVSISGTDSLTEQASTQISETDVTITQTSATIETVSYPNVSDFVEDTLVIPEGTTTISWNAYYDRDDITSIIIPESVTQICGNSFQDCDNLESVIIPDGVTSIGEGAFRYCDNLKEVVISKGVESIGDDAFANCYNLNSVTFLNEETRLKPRAFMRTPWSSMKSIKYAKNGDGYTLVSCATAYGNIIIPYGVTKIEDNAFDNSGVQSIIIPSSVTEIGNEAFKGCGDLLYVDIPDSVTIIGDEAFNNCNNLTHITIPKSVTTIGENALPRNWKEAQEQPVIINDILIYYDPEQTPENVVLPDGITEISARAFERNDNIVSITIPQSITKIGYAAFSKCNNLKTVILEGNYEDIEFSSYVFYDCYSFEEIIYNGENVKSKIKFY